MTEVYKGRGIVYGGLYNSTGALADENAKTDFGSVSKLEIDYDMEGDAIPNMRTGSGGNYWSSERVKAVKVSMVIDEQRDVPLELAMRAGLTTVTEAAVTDEEQRCFVGAFVTTNYLIKTSVAPVVTDSTGVTTYTVGTDYTVTEGGLLIPSTSTITNDTTIKIDYTKLASARIFEALAASENNYTIVVNGLNAANSNKTVRIRLHKLSFSLAKMNWLDKDLGKLEITGECLLDETITTAGLSQYYKVDKAA